MADRPLPDQSERVQCWQCGGWLFRCRPNEHSCGNTDVGPEASRLTASEYEIAFTLAGGYSEQDAIELYELIEGHRAVSGAVLACVGLKAGIVDFTPGYLDSAASDEEGR